MAKLSSFHPSFLIRNTLAVRCFYAFDAGGNQGRSGAENLYGWSVFENGSLTVDCNVWDIMEMMIVPDKGETDA